MTSLVAPIVLLVIRNKCKNRNSTEPSGKRNPGDGSDNVDGNIDQSDDEGKYDPGTQLLHTVRYSSSDKNSVFFHFIF